MVLLLSILGIACIEKTYECSCTGEDVIEKNDGGELTCSSTPWEVNGQNLDQANWAETSCCPNVSEEEGTFEKDENADCACTCTEK